MSPMASLVNFESILKEVVQAKRLSASKMGKLTEIALKSMQHDTQIVSILYRTHKSLPTAAKVSSLYVFDALSRAARHHANKQSLTGDINSTEGNCATFLLKVEGVLEGLFQDMVMVGSSESKEKTKKILDIWVKGNTFPSAILSRLMDVVKETEKVPEMKSLTPSDPRLAAPLSNLPMVETHVPAGDPQATLLALLAQAANTATTANLLQTNTNTGLVGAGLDAAQLALLQQLALAQTASSAATSAPSQLAPRAVPAPSGSAVPSLSTYRDKPLNTSLNEGARDRRHSPERVNAYDDQRNDREASFRGRGVRGRGGRSRWDDRDRDRYKGNDKGRRSRSRSPPSRYGGRRDVRPYSPPRRPTLASISTGSREQGNASSPNNRDTGKDEFGRDIRPQSPGNDSTPVSNIESTQLALSAPVDDPIPDLPSAVASNHEQMSLVAANTSSSITSASIVSNEVSSAQLGMENFDSKTFDPTSPEAWQVLGKMWQVTYGCTPSTEQLMQFVFTAAAGQVSVSGQLGTNQDWSTSSADEWTGTGRGRGGFSGSRGNVGRHGNARDGEHRTHDSSQTTDAVVLGGATVPEAGVPGEDESPVNSGSPIRSIGSGGQMQRLGDRWVFVRDPTEITS